MSVLFVYQHPTPNLQRAHSLTHSLKYYDRLTSRAFQRRQIFGSNRLDEPSILMVPSI